MSLTYLKLRYIQKVIAINESSYYLQMTLTFFSSFTENVNVFFSYDREHRNPRWYRANHPM